jgi:hypothetical protein
LIKQTLQHRKGLLRAEIAFLDEELPKDVGSVSPPMLSEGTFVEHM